MCGLWQVGTNKTTQPHSSMAMQRSGCPNKSIYHTFFDVKPFGSRHIDFTPSWIATFHQSMLDCVLNDMFYLTSFIVLYITTSASVCIQHQSKSEWMHIAFNYWNMSWKNYLLSTFGKQILDEIKRCVPYSCCEDGGVAMPNTIIQNQSVKRAMDTASA